MKQTTFRKMILDALKEKVQSSSILLPSKIDFTQKNADTIELKLNPDAVGFGSKPINMQMNDAAFEGWALALHVHLGYKIYMDIPKQPRNNHSLGHYHRFLYRVHKFSSQFKDWFICGIELQKQVDDYQCHLNDSSLVFTNNIPTGEAGNNGNLENLVEELMSTPTEDNLLCSIVTTAGLHLSPSQIYRQLPVGLFLSTPSKENSEFTGGKSAIDLWSPTGDGIAIFELKSNNKMLGIITELMFYANYMFDMYVDKSISRRPTFMPNTTETRYRGYFHLLKTYSNIHAFFLTDILHPLITADVIAEMNRGACGISYGNLHYDLRIVVNELEVVTSK